VFSFACNTRSGRMQPCCQEQAGDDGNLCHDVDFVTVQGARLAINLGPCPHRRIFGYSLTVGFGDGQ